MYNEIAFQLDKSIVSTGTLGDAADDREYWRHQTPDARLAALELLRQINYGYDPLTERLQRVLEIVRDAPG